MSYNLSIHFFNFYSSIGINASSDVFFWAHVLKQKIRFYILGYYKMLRCYIFINILKILHQIPSGNGPDFLWDSCGNYKYSHQKEFFDIVCVKFYFILRFPCVKFIFHIVCVKMNFTHGKRSVKSNFTHTMSKISYTTRVYDLHTCYIIFC